MADDVRQPYPYQSDTMISFVAPVDKANQNPLDNANDGATCSFKVYDPAKDEDLTAAAIATATSLNVSGAGLFVIGDSVELTLDDGALHASTVNAVDAAAGTVGIADQVPAPGATAGNRFRVVFGSSVTMTEYGTAALGSRDYGFRGTLADDHPVQILGQEFDVEIRFVGNPAGGLDRLDVLHGVIRPAVECGC